MNQQGKRELYQLEQSLIQMQLKKTYINQDIDYVVRKIVALKTQSEINTK